MSVKIICGYNDPEWEAYSETFYQAFDPDDWDYMVIGENKSEVETIADRLAIYEKQMVKIDGIWHAVTYHS